MLSISNEQYSMRYFIQLFYFKRLINAKFICTAILVQFIFNASQYIKYSNEAAEDIAFIIYSLGFWVN